MGLLLDGFGVERQVEVFVPVRYDTDLQTVGENLNLNLKEYYFGDQIPSLFTCLFNKNPTAINSSIKEEVLLQKLNDRLNTCPSLRTSISLERLVLLDKYAKAKEDKAMAISAECKEIANALCTQIFHTETMHRHEVRTWFHCRLVFNSCVSSYSFSFRVDYELLNR